LPWSHDQSPIYRFRGRCCGSHGWMLIWRSVDKDNQFRKKTVPYFTYGSRSGCRYGRRSLPRFFSIFFEVKTPWIPTVVQARDWGRGGNIPHTTRKPTPQKTLRPHLCHHAPLRPRMLFWQCPSELPRGRLTPPKYLPSVHSSKYLGVSHGSPWSCVTRLLLDAVAPIAGLQSFRT
jgi:hypothetical protein